MTRFTLGLATAAAVAFAAPVSAGDTKQVVKGAIVGGAGGAVVGAVVPGVSVGEGALIGGAGGAVVGALKIGKSKSYCRARYAVGTRAYRRCRGN